jgi:hypothetical protein
MAKYKQFFLQNQVGFCFFRFNADSHRMPFTSSQKFLPGVVSIYRLQAGNQEG